MAKLWVNNKGEPGEVTMKMPVGYTITICPPTFLSGATKGGYINGFRKVFDIGGKLEESDKRCVKYNHSEAGTQAIEFMDDWSHDKFFITMETMTVHDHASIGMGGPAYATYYSENYDDQEGG